MAASVGQADPKRLKCSICTEQYKEAKVLSCLHYFCKKCLEGLLTQQGGEGEWKIICPTCNQDTQISGGQIEHLPANFFLNNLFSLMALQGDSTVGRKIECENCDEDDPPYMRCTTCNQFLCEICTAAHKRGRKTKNHTLISLEEVCKAGPSATVEVISCKQHDQEDLRYYCQDCAIAICSQCLIVEHHCHKYVQVKDACAKTEQEVLKLLEETKKLEPVLKEAIESVTEKRAEVENTGERTLMEVSKCFDNLKEVLETRREKMLDDTAKMKGSKLEALESQQRGLELALASVRSSMEFTEKALKDGDQVQMLVMEKLIKEQLTKLNSASWQLEPCKDHIIRFKTNGKLVEISACIPTFGFISDIQACPRRSTVTMDNGREGIMCNSLWNQPVKFTINAKDSNGIKQADGGDDFTAGIVNPSVEPNKTLPLDVDDLGNGTYTFTYTPQVVGQYLLSVKLRGSHVQGSPFTWIVEQWSLTNLFSFSHAHATFSDNKLSASFGRYNHRTHCKGSDGFCTGYHLWKVTCDGYLSFGVIGATQITSGSFKPNEGNQWTWYEGTKYQPSFGGNSQPSTISDECQGIFELYLDCEEGELLICHQETKQHDTWNGISGKVFPVFFNENYHTCSCSLLV